MKKIVLLIAILSLCLNTVYSQVFLEKKVVDTLIMKKDTVLLYSDKSWEYLAMVNFNGILNPQLHKITSAYGWEENWDNESPYTLKNDLSKMKDTLWLCTVDDETNHSDFSMPHPGLVTSTFKYRGKRFHYGIDVDLVTGDTLVSVFDGIVRYAKYNGGGFGNLVIIRHYNGLETYYAHLSKLLVKPNQEIRAGETIGLGGKTGRAYGDHLHFEIRLFGNAIDPEQIIDFKNKKLQNENLFIHKGMFEYNKKIPNAKPSVDAPETDDIANSSSKGNSIAKKYHTVKQGDSLYAMSLKYKTTVNKICKLNNIKSTKILHSGDKIRVR